MVKSKVVHGPTFKQQLAVFNLISKCREIRSKLPEAEVAELEKFMGWAEREMDLPQRDEENVNV